MTIKYLLLVPIKASELGFPSIAELIKLAHQDGYDLIKSKNYNGSTSRFFITNTIKEMEQLCTDLDIEGVVVEITGVFDQEIEED